MFYNISSVTTLGTGSVKIIKFAEATQNESIHSNNISSSIDVESGVLLLVLMFLFLYISRVCSALWQNGETFLFHFGQYAESVPPKWKQSLENIGIGEPLVIYIQASKDFGMYDPLIIYKTILANAAATVTKLLVSEDAVASLDRAHYALAKAQYNLNVFLEGKGQRSIPRTTLRQEARYQTKLAFAKAFWKRENVRFETRAQREEKELEDRYKCYRDRIQNRFDKNKKILSGIGFGP